MSFSENFISIFNEIGKQLGIAINWSDKNIIPYINDVSDRIVKFVTLETLLWLMLTIIGLVIGIVCFAIARKKRKLYYTTNSCDDSYAGFFVLSGVLCPISLLSLMVNTIYLFKCLTIREVIIIDFLTKYIN